MGFFERVARWTGRTGDQGIPAFAATYVINLRDSTARWESITEVLRQTGLPHVVRWEGVDGRQLDDNGIRTLQSIGVLAKDLSRFTPQATKEEIGCALSHFGVLTDIVRRDLPSALILEDDTVPTGSSGDWGQRFESARADLPRDWELWFLFRCLDRLEKVERRTPTTVIPYLPYCAGAYAVSRAGAEKLLRAVVPIYQAIDSIFAEDLVSKRRIRAYAASPLLFHPGNHPSIINANNPQKDWMTDGILSPPECI